MQATSEKRRPTLAGAGLLENSKCVAAFDTSENREIARALQQKSLLKRFKLTPPVARAIAELHFGRAAA